MANKNGFKTEGTSAEKLPITPTEFAQCVAITSPFYDLSCLNELALPSANANRGNSDSSRIETMHAQISKHVAAANTDRDSTQDMAQIDALSKDIERSLGEDMTTHLQQLMTLTKEQLAQRPTNKPFVLSPLQNHNHNHHSQPEAIDLTQTDDNDDDDDAKTVVIDEDAEESEHSPAADNGKPPTSQRITPLKRKLSEVLEVSPVSTPLKPAKRRKLTHRRSSGHMSTSQTPFLQNSVSLSQVSQASENTSAHDTAQQHINNVQAYFVAFSTQFHDNVGEIALGALDMGEESGECEAIMSWMTLRYKMESLARSHDVQRVQTTALENLLRLIDEQLTLSMNASVINAAHIVFSEDIATVAKGIQAAIIALYIMTAQDIQRSLVQEDIFTKIQSLITFHVQCTFVPCKDETRRHHDMLQEVEEVQEEVAGNGNELKENRNTGNSKNKHKHQSKKATTKKNKNKKKVRKQAVKDEDAIREYWRSLEHALHALYADFCSSLLLLFNVYYEREVVPEQYISNLVQCCFETFTAQHVDDIQDGCKALLVTVFVRYTEHRSLLRDKCIEYYRGEHAYMAQRRVIDDSSKDKQSSHIHLINALILEMCQCVANYALIHKHCEEGVENTRQHHQWFEQAVVSPMQECRSVLRDIVSGIVNVATAEKKAHKLHMFYGDLENVWDLVEWPIAEYGLCVTLAVFHQILKSPKLEQKKYQQMRPYFIQGIASICCTAREAMVATKRYRIKCTQQQQPSESAASADGGGGGGVADPLAADQVIDCKCGDNRKYAALNQRFMLTCDDCESWSHGDCVGFASQEVLPTHWLCDMCRLNRDIEQHLLRINASTSEQAEALDTATKLHILLVNYLSKQLPSAIICSGPSPSYLARLSSHALSARQFHVVRWLWRLYEQHKKKAAAQQTQSPKKKTKTKKKKTRKNTKKDTVTTQPPPQELQCVLRLFDDYFRLPQSSQLKSLPTFSEHGIHAVNMQLALDRHLIAVHHQHILYLGDDLKHANAKSRSKALRALKDICDIDSSVLHEPRIQQSIMDRFHDKSALVRESAVDLIGHYVMQDATLVDIYFEPLEKRIHDVFISVRKRAIRIFRDICLQQPDNRKYKAICLALFGKMCESNESIKKLVASTFEEMWFAPNEVLANRCVVALTEKGGSKRFSRAFQQLVQQIIDIVSECCPQQPHPPQSQQQQQNTGHYLIELIDKMLQREDKKTKRAQDRSDAEKTRVFAVCEDMCSVIMDKLCAHSAKLPRSVRRMQSFVHTLYIFCKVRPRFLVRHFVTLQSYLSKPAASMKISPLMANTALTSAQRHAKHDYIGQVRVMHRLSQILTTIVPYVERSDVTTHSYVQLQKVLIQNLWNVLSFDEITFCFYMDTIQCLCVVVTHLSRDYAFITSKIFDLCMSALHVKRYGLRWCDTKWCKDKTNTQASAPYLKSLLLLGTTLKYFDVDACCPHYQFEEYKQQQQQQQHNVVRVVYEMYLYFCTDSQVHALHRHAIRGFIALLSRDPSLMELATTVDTISSFLTIERIIECETCLMALHEFFETEERRTEFLQLETEKSTNQKLQKAAAENETKDIEEEEEEHDNDDDDDEVVSDAELSDDEQQHETGLNADVAHLRHTSDNEFLVQFITEIVGQITALCVSVDTTIRCLCAQILLDWTTSLAVNPVETLNEIIALCLDEHEKTRDVANTALHMICERHVKLFGLVGMDGIKRTFVLYTKGMNATLIDYEMHLQNANANANANAVILQQILPEQVPRLFQILQDLSKSTQQQILSSISRCMMDHFEYAYCVKHKVVIDRHCHFQIAMFVFFLCQLLSAIPFDSYLPAQPFAVVQALDCSLKNAAILKRALVDTEQTLQNIISELDNDEDRHALENSEELMQGLKVCYEHACQALVYVILYQFRAFWCKLYNLSEEGIACYRLCANQKKKIKELKTKKMSSESSLTFVLELPRKTTLVQDMQTLYQALFVHKNILSANHQQHNHCNGHSQTNHNDKPNTRSKMKKTTQKTNNEAALYRIPEILNVIKAEFFKVCDAVHVENDSGVFSQIDSDVLSNDDDDDDDGGDGDTVMTDISSKSTSNQKKTKTKSKPKAKTRKKKKAAVKKKKPKRSRAKKQELLSDEEAEFDFETSDDPNDSDYNA